MSATMVDRQIKFRFQVVSKGQNNIRNCKFWTKYFYQYFQIFSIFIYSESLSMKCLHSNEHNTNRFSLLTKCACMKLKLISRETCSLQQCPQKFSSEAKQKFLQITTIKYKLKMPKSMQVLQLLRFSPHCINKESSSERYGFAR